MGVDSGDTEHLKAKRHNWRIVHQQSTIIYCPTFTTPDENTCMIFNHRSLVVEKSGPGTVGPLGKALERVTILEGVGMQPNREVLMWQDMMWQDMHTWVEFDLGWLDVSTWMNFGSFRRCHQAWDCRNTLDALPGNLQVCCADDTAGWAAFFFFLCFRYVGNCDSWY